MDAITSVLKDWDKEVLQDSSLVYDSKKLVNQLNNVIPVFGEYGLKYNTDALDSSSDWSLLNDNSIYVFKDLGKNAPALGNNKKGILIVVGDKSNEAQFVFTPHQMMYKTEGAWQKLLNTDDLQNIVNNYVKTSDTANWQKQKIFADNDWKLTSCPQGTDFGKFLQSSSVPVGFSIVRDNNKSYDFMTIKESTSWIYAISMVGSTDSSQLCTYRILNNVDQGYQYYTDMNGVADAGFLYNADGSLKWSLLASEDKDFSKEVYNYIAANKPATAFYVQDGTTGLPISSSARGLILPSHDGAGVAIMIGDNGDFYVGQADGNDPKKTTNWWKVPNTNNTVPDINTDVDLLPANIKQAVMDYRDTINMSGDTLRIAFLTDLHYQRGGSAGYAESSKDFSHLYALAGIADKVDLLVDNGDNVHGEYSNSTNILIKDNQEVIDYLYSIHPRVFVNIGNHDDGSVYNIAGHLVNQCLPDDVIMPLYQIGKHPFGEVRNGNSLYGYKDFPEYKIRVLIINDFENPDTAIDVNDGKYYTYQRARNQVITNEQIQFLKSTYESLPDDYQIVQFHHAPFVGNSGNGDWYTYQAPNHEVYEGMMNAFINSTFYAGSGTDKLFPSSVSVDFTGKPKNRLIMDIVGHEHGDIGLNKKNGIPNIVRTCSIGYGRHDMYDENINNYLESYAFDVIEITPSTRTLNFNRFGGGNSLKVNY